MSGLISPGGIPVSAATRGTCRAGTRCHCVTAEGTIPRCSANFVGPTLSKTFRNGASYLGMPPAYAVILHSVKPQNVCIAEKTARAENPAVSNSIHKAEVGRRLRVAIEAIDVTQAEVCREMGVSPSKLGNWLRGENYPDQWFITRFCDRYGITTDWIYRGVVSGAASGVAARLWKAARASEE